MAVSRVCLLLSLCALVASFAPRPGPDGFLGAIDPIEPAGPPAPGPPDMPAGPPDMPAGPPDEPASPPAGHPEEPAPPPAGLGHPDEMEDPLEEHLEVLEEHL